MKVKLPWWALLILYFSTLHVYILYNKIFKVLFGAMVSGPDRLDRYEDSRSEKFNDVALDYTAAIMTAVAGLKQDTQTSRGFRVLGSWRGWVGAREFKAKNLTNQKTPNRLCTNYPPITTLQIASFLFTVNCTYKKYAIKNSENVSFITFLTYYSKIPLLQSIAVSDSWLDDARANQMTGWIFKLI